MELRYGNEHLVVPTDTEDSIHLTLSGAIEVQEAVDAVRSASEERDIEIDAELSRSDCQLQVSSIPSQDLTEEAVCSCCDNSITTDGAIGLFIMGLDFNENDNASDDDTIVLNPTMVVHERSPVWCYDCADDFVDAVDHVVGQHADAELGEQL